MATTAHTFIDIFNSEIENHDETVQLKKIVIPIIQRDYAQGRKGNETARIRTRFLESLYKAVVDSPITLDFVYGDIDESGIMTPLDGQQRLTTLFLLHWYAAKKDGIDPEECACLSAFSYETRYSARDFCKQLICHQPSFSGSLSDEIVDQPWFPLDWKKDQTVSSMLVMLDAIDSKFSDVQALWSKLADGAISFYFLPIKDMGLTDELYIKMNSRGKPLTLFEHFKAELERNLKEVDADTATRILQKIDREWSKLLWNYRGNDNIIDDEFLRYFRFICDVICYRSGGSPQGKSSDEFDLLREYFSLDNVQVAENIVLFERLFDCWCDLSGNTPSTFLNQWFSYEHEARKVKIESRYQIDIFDDCLRNYADIIGGRNRRFPLNRIVILYGITLYLLNKDKVTEKDFVRRLRIINNLTQNSGDEISDSESRTSGNRMPAILRQVDSIMLGERIDIEIENNFNPFQLEEEKSKLIWCDENQGLVEALFELEDHPLLYGQVSIVGLGNPQLFAGFKSLFQCDLDAVDCALLAIGNYCQCDRNGWRYQLGSNSSSIDVAWTKLFHSSANSGYDKTHAILIELLSKTESFTDDYLREVAGSYITKCEERKEFDWRYYYIKYPAFRMGRYGKYCWMDYAHKPYEMLALYTEYSWSSNAKQPFMSAIDNGSLNRDDNGCSLYYDGVIVRCKNSAFVICLTETGEELSRIMIAQNQDGIDTENRIEKGIAEIPEKIEKFVSMGALSGETKTTESGYSEAAQNEDDVV
jgi:hypothetical protein